MKAPAALQAASIGQPAEGVTGPVLARCPDEQDEDANHDQQQLAGEEAGQDHDGGGDYPEVAEHERRIPDLGMPVIR